MRALPLFAILLSLSACQGGGTIEVLTEGDAVSFVIDRYWHNEACIDGLSVRAADAAKGDYIWAITQDDESKDCVGSVEFGIVPQGFQPASKVQMLEKGREYVVDTGGTGWIARTTFIYGR